MEKELRVLDELVQKKPTTRRQTLVQQIIHGLSSPNYDIDEFQTDLLKEALDTSLETRNIAQNMKNDITLVTKSIFQAHGKLNTKQNSVDQLKLIVSDKRDIAKKASSYLAHIKAKVTEDEIKRINAEKDLLKNHEGNRGCNKCNCRIKYYRCRYGNIWIKGSDDC